MLKIIFSAGGYLMNGDFFRCPAAQHPANPVEELRAGHEELIVGGNLHGVAQRCAASRYHAYFVDRIGKLTVSSDKRVAYFMIRNTPALFFSQTAAFSLRPGDHLFHGIFQLVLTDLGLMPARSQ